MGMTVSDAVRVLLTRTAREGALPIELLVDEAAHDAWFRKTVQEAIDDQRAPIPNDQVKTHFEKRRAGALSKSDQGKP
jgi:DNA-damage-inducible protein J